MNRLILIAGASRSGTSLFSGMLKALGAYVPQPEVVPDDTNPRGFSEPRWVVEYHAKLLRAVGVQVADARPDAWAKTAEIAHNRLLQLKLERWVQRQFRHGDHVLVKDPRLLWFIPLWVRAADRIATPRFATVLRHPLEVIQSQQTYYVAWHPNNRAAAWLNTMLFTERATRGHLRAFVPYDELLGDWMLALSRANAAMGLKLVENATASQMRLVNQLVDPSLRRSDATWSSLGVDRRLVDLTEDVWALFNQLNTAGTVGTETIAGLDSARAAYVELYGFAETTAQSSVFAAQRARLWSLLTASRWSPNQTPLTPTMAAQKIAARARRTGLRALRQLGSGSSSDDTTGPPSVTSTEPQRPQ